MSVTTIHTLMNHALSIKQAVEERFTLKDADQIAIRETEELYKLGINIIKSEVKGQPLEETPFPVVLTIAQVLNENNIRCFDLLQNRLSKVCRVFTEIVFYKSGLELRKTNDTEKSFLVDSIDRALKTRPAFQIETRFQLQAALNAAKALTNINGLFKTYFLPSLDQTIPDLKLRGKTLQVGSSFKPQINLLAKCIEMYFKEHVEGWFRECFDWSWLAVSAITEDDLTYLTNGKIEDYYNRDQSYALCSLEVLITIIENSKADPKLKQTLIAPDKDGANLYSIASLKHWKKPFWEARYRATLYLIQLSEKEDYKNACINHLVIRLIKEDRVIISDLIRFTLQNSQEKHLWISAYKKVNIKKLKDELKEFFEKVQKEMQQKIDRKTEKTTQSTSSFAQQSDKGDYESPFTADNQDYGHSRKHFTRVEVYRDNAEIEKLRQEMAKQTEMYQKSLISIDDNLAFIESLIGS